MSVRRGNVHIYAPLWCNAAELNSQKPLGSDWPDVGGLGRRRTAVQGEDATEHVAGATGSVSLNHCIKD